MSPVFSRLIAVVASFFIFSAEKALHEVKNRVSHASDNYYYRAKKAVYRADDYVHEKPWQGIGAGAAVGLVLGLLLARR